MDRGKAMRRNPTDAERLLWERLRHAQLGHRFRRQLEIAGYFVDFICLEHGLVVELDGGQHADNAAYDEKRTRLLEQFGLRVLRFWNNDVLSRPDDVVAAIVGALDSPSPPHPNPLPQRGRGRGSRERIERCIDESIASASTESGLGRGDGSASNSPLPQAPLGGEGWGEGEKPRFAQPQDFRDSRHAALALRASLCRLIRRFFDERRVLEVETPVLSAAGNTDPNIESFTTRFTGHRDAGSAERWLRTSPEFPLKRLLAEGIGDCYELGRVFRNGEAGRRHNPEFTMLEWYRLGWDHHALMREACALVQFALDAMGRTSTVRVYSYRELFVEYFDLDPFAAGDDELAAPLAEFSIDPAGLVRDDWLDLLITLRIQPQFTADRITVVHDYPASQCALARLRDDADITVAERFELYLGPYELANGYHELNDATEQRSRFERDNARRRERGLREVPLDENLLAVLGRMPDCAGVALGIERLLMCLAQTDDIRNVLAYPFADA
jgi:lysyl-tRNA synthetase class 2